MKAISLWQPWATLIAAGIKPFETRSWAPPRSLIGQTIAIHAARKVDKDAAALAEELVYGQRGHDIADHIEAISSEDHVLDHRYIAAFGHAVLPVGVVVCTARLDAAFRMGPNGTVTERITSRPMPECFTPRIDDYGDFSPGRWVWLLKDVHPFNPPLPAVGKQGFFELPQGWMVQ